jgi:hypothetical protein
LCRQGRTINAIVSTIYRKPRTFAQRCRNVMGNPSFVFNDEYTHVKKQSNISSFAEGESAEIIGILQLLFSNAA